MEKEVVYNSVLLQVRVSTLLTKYIHYFTQSLEYPVIFAFLPTTHALLPQRCIDLYMLYRCPELRTSTGSFMLH